MVAMISKLSNHLYAWAKGRTVLAVFAALILFMVVTLPLLPKVYPGSSSMKSLDDPAFYTPAQVFSILEGWGAEGRTYQLWLHLTWDIAVPVLGFFCLGLSLSWLFQRSFQPGSRLRKLNLVSLSSAFDLLENFSLAGLLVAYPAHPAWAAWLKTAFTSAKFAFLMALLLLLAAGLILAARNRFKVLE